jgi:uncharacterized membrane protein
MDWNSTRPEAREPAAGKGPQAPAIPFDDARMEVIMGRLLQVGVLLAASVMLVGGVMYAIAHTGESSNYRVFTARPVELRHPAALLRGIGRGDASAIVELGILLLVATPICRVIFGVIAFAIERDRLYVAISLTVLAVLLFGMLHGG